MSSADLAVRIVWVSAASILAGCIDGELPTSDPSPIVPPHVEQLARSDETAVLHGFVVDSEYIPVPDAQVGIPSHGLATTTDVAGYFSLAPLVPGVYEVVVAAVGFLPQLETMQLIGDEQGDVVVTLEALPTVTPFHTTQIQDGLLGCGLAWRPALTPSQFDKAAACGIVADTLEGSEAGDLDDFMHEWEVEQPVQGWLASELEMRWDATQAGGHSLALYWEVLNCSNKAPFQFGNPRGPSVLRAAVNQQGIQSIVDNATLRAADCGSAIDSCNADHCSMQTRVFPHSDTLGPEAPVGAGVVVQQPFRQFHTTFYYSVPPPGFTAAQ